MKWNVTPEDFLKGERVSPGWHPAVIVGYSEKMSKMNATRKPGWKPSLYIEMIYRITAGDYAGKYLYGFYSEKAQAMIVPLIEAITGETVDRKANFEFEPSKDKFFHETVDVEVDIVKGDNGQDNSVIKGYKPYSGPEIGSLPEGFLKAPTT